MTQSQGKNPPDPESGQPWNAPRDFGTSGLTDHHGRATDNDRSTMHCRITEARGHEISDQDGR
jgi:hypothetical protein